MAITLEDSYWNCFRVSVRHEFYFTQTGNMKCSEHSNIGLFPAGCLFLVACWPCFQRKWTHRLKTALFMVDASAPSNTREATGPPMFICHVRPTHSQQNSHPPCTCYPSTICDHLFNPVPHQISTVHASLSHSSPPQTTLRRSSESCWRSCSQ